MRDKLVIIPCGKKKIWDDGNILGAVDARNAYTGTMFRLGVKYAEVCDADWVVLSAKYGFIFPDDRIEPYDVTFNNKASNPISFKELDDQLTKLNLRDYQEIIALGGAKYRELVIELFECRGKKKVLTPFAGLSMGRYLRALKEAIKTETIEAVPRWYDSLENKPVKFEDGKTTFPWKYWRVPTVDDAFCGFEGPPPTNLDRELARFEINEKRKILLKWGPRVGAWDQFHEVTYLIGKKLLIQMSGSWDTAPYPIEAFCVGVNLNHDEEGFTQCYMCLKYVLNLDTPLRPADDMYDGKYRLTEAPDGVSLLSLADVYELSVLEDQA
jgi:hypothetical protein